MIEVSEDQFQAIVSDAIDNIPEQYAAHIKNLAFIVEDEPTEYQRQKLELLRGQTLYGLYEGIPLTKRGAGYNLVLPDKITIFKRPIEMSSNSYEGLVEQVRHTLWHEVAHYYGLDHSQIHDLENK
jgi:predicted Zn-dependent protease with MMP-like domain